ncbi:MULTISPECIES: MarR family winged helix-turn-helix transcriptional regulator [unclassified Romboutsia]|uniref:MarR family winged helix-turn-helix transcriptional regulator n=1 Tax=unclassified Romboutsia TaxID=2626894 RepID=UPI000822091D|nr:MULTISPECIES: MarR family winged helix-turn-helix transcriptional regulator [unclassified Romboutsia]SCG95790.1 MarR family [uncultured Clostridium sp.]
MQSYFKDLNIIDLISEKHAKLRKLVRDKWVELGEEYISDTESYILAIIEREPMSVAQIARIIDISRQGVHKCTKDLILRGYIYTEYVEGNSRDKILLLTEKGKRFFEETLLLKESIEEEIKTSIGRKEFEILKDCLSKRWF